MTFTIDYENPSTADVLRVRKPPDLLEAYEPLIRRNNPSRIVEIGIAGGGSTALLALLADPALLVALEVDPTPIPGLTEFLTSQGMRDRVRLHFGVDQGDRDAVDRIVEAEFEEPLDLVVDDASHLLDETRASFETLFPRLRDGGLYVIEDWAAADRLAQWQAKADADDLVSPRPRPMLENARRLLMVPERDRPVSDLVIELVLVMTAWHDVVQGVEIGRHWVAVTRGPGVLDPHTFRVADLYADHYGLLPSATSVQTNRP